VSATASGGATVTSLSKTTTTTVGAAFCTPLRRPVINELVVEPQSDWDDSGGGGNGTPFDDSPGTSVAPNPSVTPADEWVEVLTNTGSPDELKNWTLEFVDATGAPISLKLTSSNVRARAGSPYVVIGAPGAIALTSAVKLRDNLGTLVDELNLATVHSLIGFATGVGDEAIARAPDGFDSNNATDFKRRAATIGNRNP
jgi:hypothetical protein